MGYLVSPRCAAPYLKDGSSVGRAGAWKKNKKNGYMWSCPFSACLLFYTEAKSEICVPGPSKIVSVQWSVKSGPLG